MSLCKTILMIIHKEMISKILKIILNNLFSQWVTINNNKIHINKIMLEEQMSSNNRGW